MTHSGEIVSEVWNSEKIVIEKFVPIALSCQIKVTFFLFNVRHKMLWHEKSKRFVSENVFSLESFFFGIFDSLKNYFSCSSILTDKVCSLSCLIFLYNLQIRKFTIFDSLVTVLKFTFKKYLYCDLYLNGSEVIESPAL